MTQRERQCSLALRELSRPPAFDVRLEVSARILDRVEDEIITSLEMTSPEQLRDARPAPAPIELREVHPDEAGLCRDTWTRIGAPHGWTRRAKWSDDEWLTRLAPPEVRGFLALIGGEVAGYLELEADRDGNVGIAFFGLVPEFVGKGFGGAFLTAATKLAWSLTSAGGTPRKRVWLQTSSRDHPNALPNYEARGFRIFRRERRSVDLTE
jgi:GNAT superfamily N-acetyltransferase